MFSTSKIVVLLGGVLTATIASPAFAQSPDHTGSQMPYYYDGTGKQTWGSWGPQDANGLYGYLPPRRSRQYR